MNSLELTKDLVEINNKVCQRISAITDRKTMRVTPSASRLVYPQHRDGSIRISEQEARIIYCSVLNEQSKYWYSVETPTEKEYSFEGSKELSARSDISLYTFSDELGFSKQVNVEFKAHNPPPESIAKDVEKIINEGLVGNWFHVLADVDKRTLPALFEKFSRALLQKPTRLPPITFCVFIREKKWAMIKVLDAGDERAEDCVPRFFRFDYKVDQDKVIVLERNDWVILDNPP